LLHERVVEYALHRNKVQTTQSLMMSTAAVLAAMMTMMTSA